MSSLAGGGVLNQVRHADGAKERAHRARRDIAALAAAGLGVSELHTAAIRPDRRSRQREANRWAAIDPETLVISTIYVAVG